MPKESYRILLAFASIASGAAFVERPVSWLPCPTSSSSSTTNLYAEFADLGMEAARTSFPLWLFGAIGSGGIARPVFPRRFGEWRELQKMKGVGPTKGGPTLGINPLCGFPEDICIADLEAVIDNTIEIEKLIEQYPVENSYLASMGLLTAQAFTMANDGLNPLAVKAVFDSFGKGSGVEPSIAQERLDQYREDLSLLQANLLKKSLLDSSAVISLAFLVGLADVTTSSLFYRGYFPDWPGGVNFPFSVFTEPNGGLLSIPDYWVG